MPRNQQYLGVYGAMDFPPYRYEEFPKAIYDPSGGDKLIGIAKHAAEELDILQSHSQSVMKDKVKSQLEKDNEALLAELEKLRAMVGPQGNGAQASPTPSPVPQTEAKKANGNGKS